MVDREEANRLGRDALKRQYKSKKIKERIEAFCQKFKDKEMEDWSCRYGMYGKQYITT